MRYTVRKVPRTVDKAIRKRARARGQSLNQVAVEALASGLGVEKSDILVRDLSDIAGTWVDDPAIDAALAAQDRVDRARWK